MERPEAGLPQGAPGHGAAGWRPPRAAVKGPGLGVPGSEWEEEPQMN